MANRIENVDGVPCLFLDEGGNANYRASGGSSNLSWQLVNGSSVFIDGTKSWGDVFIAPPLLTDDGTHITGNRLPFNVKFQAYNAFPVIKYLELSGGAEWDVISERLKDDTDDLPAGEYGITVDNENNPGVSSVKVRQATYNNNTTRALPKQFHATRMKVMRGGFANFLLKSDDLTFPDPNDFLDIYIKDSLSVDTHDGEGMYAGNFKAPPGQHPVKFRAENTVFARTASESFQAGHLIDGSYVKNCLIMLGGLDPTSFENFQSNGMQLNHRYGKTLVENCMILGSGASILSINHFLGEDNAKRKPDDEVRFRNCLIGFSRVGSGYIGIVPDGSDISLAPKVVFEDCMFIGMGENNVLPNPTKGNDASKMFAFENSDLKVEAYNCKIDNRNSSITGILPNRPNAIEQGTTFEDLPIPAFVNDGIFSLGISPFKIIHYDSSVQYTTGQYIVSPDRKLYEVIADSINNPLSDTTKFRLVDQSTSDDTMPDNWQLAENDPYRLAGIGLLPTAPDYNYKLKEGVINANANQSSTVTGAKEVTTLSYTIISYAETQGKKGALVKKLIG